MKRFDLKLDKMRKAQSFIVCPRPTTVGDDYNLVTIQSDKRICQFDKTTGVGVLSDGKGGHPGNIKLSKFMGAIAITMPQDLLAEIVESIPVPGTHIGGGIIIG